MNNSKVVMSMKLIKMCKVFFEGFYRQFFFLFFLGLITSFISFMNPIVNANIITSITNMSLKSVIILAGVYFLFQLSTRLVDFISNTTFSKVKLSCILNIRMKVCAKILDIQMHEFDVHSSGVFLERIKNDPNDIITIFNEIQDYLLEIITNVGVIFYVYIINAWMGLFFSISIVALFIIQKERIKVLLKRTKEWKVIQEENSTVLNEFTRGIKEIKVLNLDIPFLSHIKKTFEKNYEKRLDMNYQTYWYNFFYHTVRALIVFIILVAGAMFLYKGKITPTDFLVIYMYRTNIFSFVLNSSKLVEAIGSFKVSASRIFDILEEEQFETDHYKTKKNRKLKGEIQLQNITFAYQQKPVLKNISCYMKEKETTAIVGKSGSGKTTILNLISKLYEVEDNHVYLDGQDINNLSKKTLRDSIVYITQNPYIFNMSIKENLRLVNKNLTEKEMINACKKACIHDFIMTLPEQYNTVLGEAGFTISGGERQRLAIARALCKNASIILLDEATSALDNETQKKIQKTIKNLSETCTVIIVAHRLSTIINADKIIVLGKGTIIAEGTHEKLLKECKYYEKMYLAEEKKNA